MNVLWCFRQVVLGRDLSVPETWKSGVTVKPLAIAYPRCRSSMCKRQSRFQIILCLNPISSPCLTPREYQSARSGGMSPPHFVHRITSSDKSISSSGVTASQKWCGRLQLFNAKALMEILAWICALSFGFCSSISQRHIEGYSH